MDNIFYNGLVEMLPNISQKDSSVDLEKPLPLMRFISSDAHHYYSYGGSLTTAPCIEQVIWIDFFQPIGLSEVQVRLCFVFTKASSLDFSTAVRLFSEADCKR